MNDKSNERNKIIVNNIKTLATQRGTNIAAIERELIIGNGTIGKWAKAAKSPPYETLYKIATYFGVTVADLTGETGEKGIKKETITGSDGFTAKQAKGIELIKSLSEDELDRAMAALEAFFKK
jgi:transcriptional regulator with XRE-family HTH domain